jgi:hypothetical protein
MYWFLECIVPLSWFLCCCIHVFFSSILFCPLIYVLIALIKRKINNEHSDQLTFEPVRRRASNEHSDQLTFEPLSRRATESSDYRYAANGKCIFSSI